MTNYYPPINAKVPHLMHGGDYNPDQWPRDIWGEDMRLMKLAHVNMVSVGIFSWVALEPAEGQFEFGWLDRVMDMLAENNVYAALATPSGARPAWLSQKYPEVLRVRPDRGRNLHGTRHNHCFTSPVYREKTQIINTKLAERYKDHPALALWHVSNEYGGECHCDLCQAAFREWLQAKYDSLDALNHAWWAAFWSHTYTDWSQIESPSLIGEHLLHGLTLDWKRFVTAQTVDFMQHEIVPLREITPDVPLTTNMMGLYPGLNYVKLAEEIDVVSYDSYPRWHLTKPDYAIAAREAFIFDYTRGLRGDQPWMLLESVPSKVNWAQYAKPKRPGMHRVSALQAVAHGSDSVMYFQWRQSRGSCEKFHGAVVSHAGHENTREFQDVADVGQMLTKLDDVIGAPVKAEVAIIFDTENRWAIDDLKGLMSGDRGYPEACIRHYQAFWKLGIQTDVINMDQPLDGYRLVIAPMLYMLRPGVAERITAFVENGGVFVATYLTGLVDENDLCFLGGFPGPLRDVLGIWTEETDTLTSDDVNHIMLKSASSSQSAVYAATEICDLIHAESATVLATYQDDFYAGQPALTVNNYGQGRAYYIASRNEQRFLDDFYGALVRALPIAPVIDTALPEGVSVRCRTDGTTDFIFVMNFTPRAVEVALDQRTYTDMLTNLTVTRAIQLTPFGVHILRRPAAS